MPGGGKLNSSPLRREQFVFQGGYVEIDLAKKEKLNLEKSRSSKDEKQKKRARI